MPNPTAFDFHFFFFKKWSADHRPCSGGDSQWVPKRNRRAPRTGLKNHLRGGISGVFLGRTFRTDRTAAVHSHSVYEVHTRENKIIKKKKKKKQKKKKFVEKKKK